MDIYFCDLCGVRVTDADLRAGHGIRSHWDVICGTCLEMGHGKDWLSQRSKGKANTASPTLDAARDRHITLEDEAPARRVASKPIQPEPPSEPTPSDAHPVLSETDFTSTTKVPTPDRAKPMHLAAAANMFSALGAAAPTAAKPTTGASSPAASDDIDDLADAAHAPLPEDTSPARGSSTVGDSASPFTFGESPKKDETVSGLPILPDTGDDILALDEAPKPAAKDKPSTGTSSRHRKSGTASRTGKAGAKGGSKSSTKMTARSRRGSGKDPSRMILIGSAISLVVIGILFAVVMKVRQPERRTVQVGTDDKEIAAMIRDTEQKVNGSLRSDDLAAMESALAALNATAARIEDFEKTAARSGDGEEKVAGVLQRLRWPDVYMQSRPLRERIGILKQRGGH